MTNNWGLYQWLGLGNLMTLVFIFALSAYALFIAKNEKSVYAIAYIVLFLVVCVSVNSTVIYLNYY